MAKLTKTEAAKFAQAFLCSMDADQAAKAVGRKNGAALLSMDLVQREIQKQREERIRQEDVTRRLAKLAYGRVNDCVRLVLEEGAELEGLDLDLLTEVRRSDKGSVEVKLVDRLAVLEQLERILQQDQAGPEALLRALGPGEQEKA